MNDQIEFETAAKLPVIPVLSLKGVRRHYVQGKSIIDRRKMLMPLQGGIITRHKNTQGDALGYLIAGPPGRNCTSAL